MSTDPRLFPNLTDPMRTDYEGPPVRDIREAMHPASAPPSGEAPWTPGTPAKEITVRNVRLPVTIPLAEVPPGVLADIDRQHDAEKSPPRLRLGGGPIAIAPATVATLPDGARINLPAGTVLREQGLAEQVRAGTLGVGMADDPAKLRGAFTREHSPDVVLTQARDLLQRARVPLAETGAADVLADVDAFLAGAAPPEHPVIALVRSFVGKPGDRGPVWSALEQLQVRIDAGDLAAVRSAGIELAAALNHRLGQMHDALGRDTTEDRTL